MKKRYIWKSNSANVILAKLDKVRRKRWGRPKKVRDETPGNAIDGDAETVERFGKQKMGRPKKIAQEKEKVLRILHYT